MLPLGPFTLITSWLPALVVAGFIVFCSVSYDIPYLSLPFDVPQLDKWGHLAAYAAFTWSAFRGCRYGGGSLGSRYPVLLAVLIALALGGVCETWQIFLPYRTPEVADLLANAAGSCLAVIAWQRLPLH